MSRPVWTLGGKVALVTGAGARLGRAIAEGLGELGADVAVHFHSSREGADATVDKIRLTGNRAEAFSADVSKPEAIEPLVARVEASLGPISILVNSAGLFERHDVLSTPLESMERQWAVNARAPFLLAQAVGRGMVSRGVGDIINLVDIGGMSHVWKHYAAYTMTKAALASLTKSLALELAPHVRVNGVAPGTVLAPEDLDDDTLARLKAQIPAQRFGSPDDIVEAVRFLLAGPRFITGQIIAVDGGRSLSSLSL